MSWLQSRTVTPSVRDHPKKVDQLACPGGVETLGRLIEQKELRPADKGARQSEPLAHTSGPSAHFPIGDVGDTGHTEDLIYRRVRHAVSLGQHLENTPRRQVRVEARPVYETCHAGQGRHWTVDQVLTTEYLGFSLVGLNQPEKDPQQRALASPVRAEQAVHLPSLDDHVDTGQSGDIAKALHEARDLDGVAHEIHFYFEQKGAAIEVATCPALVTRTLAAVDFVASYVRSGSPAISWRHGQRDASEVVQQGFL